VSGEGADRIYEIYRMLEPKPKELLENPRRVFIKEGPGKKKKKRKY
jgi:hypothetical protein